MGLVDNKKMRVIYSVGSALGGGGIGNTGNFAAREIYKQGFLKKLICLENNQDFKKILDFWPYLLIAVAFGGVLLWLKNRKKTSQLPQQVI